MVAFERKRAAFASGVVSRREWSELVMLHVAKAVVGVVRVEAAVLKMLDEIPKHACVLAARLLVSSAGGAMVELAAKRNASNSGC